MSLTVETFEEILSAGLPVVLKFPEGTTLGEIPRIKYLDDILGNKIIHIVFYVKSSKLSIIVETRGVTKDCGLSGDYDEVIDKAFEIVKRACSIEVPISGNKILPHHTNIERYSHNIMLLNGEAKYDDRLNDLLALIRLERKLLSC